LFVASVEPVSAMYKTVVADPPWPYAAPGQIGKTLEHRPNRDKGLSAHGAGSRARYGAMATNAFIVEAHDVARAWGFRPITLITWCKVREDGQPSMKMGRYFRGCTEHCLFGVRGSLRLRGPAASTALLTPRTTHSEKPEQFYQLVEEQSHGPYLELFARRRRAGWSAWGDEVDSDVQLVA
jgi:N6-adenosine-specific RNA methylase IME4